MASLKDLDNITTVLNNWLIKNKFDARVHGLDTDFFWYHDDTIGYTLTATEESATEWNILLNELGCNLKLDTFFTAFLHELGHSETYYTFTEEEISEQEELKDLISEDPSSFALTPHQAYFHLPVELAATQWAVNFINNNHDKVKELVDNASAAIQQFYINSITKEI